MQNPLFLKKCIDELEINYPKIEILKGDSYYPILAIKVKDLLMPENVIQAQVDITIPMARCAGYIPGASLAGLHVHSNLQGSIFGYLTSIPFCDPVEDINWLKSVEEYYPLYEKNAEQMLGSYYLCLNNPRGQPETPKKLIEITLSYLRNWQTNAIKLAQHHGAVARGIVSGDAEISRQYVDHIVEHVDANVKQRILEIAYPRN